MRPTFEEWLRRQETLLLSTDGVTVHQWLRDHGVPVEDGAEITPEIMWSRTRPGRYRDLLVDRRYARESETDGLPKGFDEWEEHEQVEHLRRLEDDERIAEELNPHQRPTFYVYYGDPMALPGAVRGLTCRMWRWEPEIPWKPVRDGEMTCHREVLARDILRRRILVTAIVTIVRVEEIGGLLSPRYVVRDAEPVEAARVLCAEATWRDDRDPA
ncbi:hypothetical protein AB0O28_33785 [Microbispora sp. NPDC088329]|uniref:hypothetical protein n=1 Tax=Microbispora sp. NPDC088329 TaxID=3154869 RepID=UPI00341CEAD9